MAERWRLLSMFRCALWNENCLTSLIAKKNVAKKSIKPPMKLSDEAALRLVDFADSGSWSYVYRHVPDCSGDCQQHYHNCQQCQRHFRKHCINWSLELMNWIPQALGLAGKYQFDFNIDWQKTITDLISFLQNWRREMYSIPLLMWQLPFSVDWLPDFWLLYFPFTCCLTRKNWAVR